MVFSSASFGIVFTLESYAKKYNEIYETKIDPKQFCKFLWGAVYFNKETRKFSRKPSEQAPNRSFVDFVLEPMYKLIGYTISEEKDFLAPLLSKLNIQLKLSDTRTSSFVSLILNQNHSVSFST